MTEPVDAPLVRSTVDSGIATLTLDSPANRNALSSRLVRELAEGLDAACADPSIRAVVLTHTGPTFCAGADLREAAGRPVEDGLRALLGLLRSIVHAPKPVLCLVNGSVRAGGMGLVGACDLVVAHPASTFAFTEARLGVAASVISLTTLPRMDERSAARYLLTGAVFDAAEAARVGLVTVVDPEPERALSALLGEVRACSPQGLAASKELTTRVVRRELAERAEEMVELSARLFATEEAAEGMMSFLQRRPPAWASPE